MSESNNDAYHKISAPPAAEPSGCPFDSTFTPFDADYLLDPYPQLHALSQATPVFYAEKLGYLVVTGMDNVVEVLKNHRVFSSENVQDPVFPLCEEARAILSATDYNPQAVMSNCQQPDHTRIRKFTRDGFSARRMRVLEPYIRETADHLITAMLERGSPAEFVSSFAHPLPGQVIFRFIGFPEADHDQLIRWTANRLFFTWGRPSAQQQVEIAENMLKYWRYCRAFVALRSEEPADDLTSELLAAHKQSPEELSRREVESIVYGLSFAGHEIVSNFLSLTLLNVMPQRDQWQALCQDPALIPNALEEVLRIDSPQTSWRRVTTQDTDFHGVRVPKGTRVFLSLGAANHDPATFAAPDAFDMRRANANRHVSFGHGIHFCLGARLARLEGEIAVEALTRRIPSLRLVEDQQLQFSPNITFRGPTRLQVAWDA
ncbi:MAG: cytochrome P450 [Pseudomonadales bacterium]